jgi:hypothetical protein
MLHSFSLVLRSLNLVLQVGSLEFHVRGHELQDGDQNARSAHMELEARDDELVSRRLAVGSRDHEVDTRGHDGEVVD